jgi:tetratricopeptide (TPR) repeat protein
MATSLKIADSSSFAQSWGSKTTLDSSSKLDNSGRLDSSSNSEYDDYDDTCSIQSDNSACAVLSTSLVQASLFTTSGDLSAATDAGYLDGNLNSNNSSSSSSSAYELKAAAARAPNKKQPRQRAIEVLQNNADDSLSEANDSLLEAKDSLSEADDSLLEQQTHDGYQQEKQTRQQQQQQTVLQDADSSNNFNSADDYDDDEFSQKSSASGLDVRFVESLQLSRAAEEEQSPAVKLELTSRAAALLLVDLQHDLTTKHISILLRLLDRLLSLAEQASTDNGNSFVDLFERSFSTLSQQSLDCKQVLQFANLLYKSVHILSDEQGFAALNQACDLWLEHHAMAPPKAISLLDKRGADLEALGQYDDAMACYEKALLMRNVAHGNEHVSVANSLLNVARIMELQGNVEGSLDLIRAAQGIFSSASNQQHEQQQMHDDYAQAVALLTKSIECAENNNNTMIKTALYHALGQVYVGLGDYVSATVCLVEAAKEDAEDEQVFALMQQVEFLQRQKGEMMHDEDEDGFCTADLVSLSFDEQQEQHDCRLVEPLSPYSSSSSSSDDDEGTAYYDSESVSAFLPFVAPYVAYDFQGMATVDFLPNEVATADDLDKVHASPPETSDFDVMKTSVMDNVLPPIVVSPESLLAQSPKIGKLPPRSSSSTGRSMSESVDKVSSSSSRAGGLMMRLGSPRQNKDQLAGLQQQIQSKDQVKAGEVSERSSLAKTLTEKFRRQRKGDFRTLSAADNAEVSKGSVPSMVPTTLALPSEEDYHTAVEAEEDYHTDVNGPVSIIEIRSDGSDVSSVTMRMEDPNTMRNNGQEWWWGVSAEGFSRWFPSTYVFKAVEAAEGFLSAKSIHSKVKSPPLQLDYASDETSTDEVESAIFADHASAIGIADSKTKGSVAMRRNQHTAPLSNSPKQDSTALSIYSERCKVTDVDAEIQRVSKLVMQQENEYGKDHPDLAELLFTLAVLQSRHHTNTGPAIEFATEALRIQKQARKFHEASRSLHFLADLYLHQKQLNTALTFYLEALRLERDHYGDLSDEAVKTLNCIGTVHSLLSDFAQAMASYQEALRILQECYGENAKHPLVLETLCQMGSVYYSERNSFSNIKKQNRDNYTTFIKGGMLETIGRAHEERGSYKLAISFFEEKLQYLESGRSASNSDDFEEVAETMNSLGMLSSRAGFLSEAIDYYEKALTIQIEVGCDQVQIATSQVLIGSVHYQLGDWERALKMQHEALDVLMEELGTDHQTVAATLFQIGIIHASLCQFDLAMNMFSQAQTIQTLQLGHDHPATLRTRREIGNIFSVNVSECDSALEQFDEILEAQRRIHGDRHPNIAETLHSIGRAYSRRGDYSSALQILEECYYMRTEFLGHDAPSQATTLLEISMIHLKRNRLKKALRIVKVVLSILEVSF